LTNNHLLQNSKHPFGMMMPGRGYSAQTSYRFGFNGKENDNEVKGEGNQQNYGMRVYDPRIGKFLSVDPLTYEYPQLTPYQFASNTPICAIDLDGAESMFGWSIGLPTGAANEVVQGWQNSHNQITNGTASGVKKSVVKTWGFFTNDIWKAKTWENGMYSFGTFCDITFGNFEGQNDQLAYNVIQPHVDNFNKKVINGNAFTRSEFFGELGTDILTAKAINKVFTVTKGMLLAERIAVRTNFAKAFYERAGFSPAKALEHMEGIDFTQGVKPAILKEGTVVQQWVGENGVGNYFTTLENGAAQNLGMSYEGRTLRQFTLTKDVEVLQSTAAKYKGHAGGGTQYFSPEIKNNITEVKAP
jgi:RHS repeat-associated protein